ncbi:MAG: recombinase family protein [Alphaproteobacteria bacterium]|jgi:DNA invertase Pin-like site-specific DNA recombinase|nr:recombinase family protein [Candidatus Jidaibacter sp.]
MLIGYARVSTSDQSLDLQIDALTKAGCEKIFAEKITGSSADRPELNNLKEFIRDGDDTVVVYKLDRLGRSLKNLVAEMQSFQERGIGFKSLQENIDTTTSGGKLFFHIFAALAEFERDIIRERTQAGLNSARARGRLGGRPKKLTESQLYLMRKLYADKSNEISDICKMFKISRPTLFRLVKISN